MSSSGAQANGSSFDADPFVNGRFVSFVSGGTLVPRDDNNAEGAFLLGSLPVSQHQRRDSALDRFATWITVSRAGCGIREQRVVGATEPRLTR